MLRIERSPCQTFSWVIRVSQHIVIAVDQKGKTRFTDLLFDNELGDRTYRHIAANHAQQCPLTITHRLGDGHNHRIFACIDKSLGKNEPALHQRHHIPRPFTQVKTRRRLPAAGVNHPIVDTGEIQRGKCGIRLFQRFQVF